MNYVNDPMMPFVCYYSKVLMVEPVEMNGS